MLIAEAANPNTVAIVGGGKTRDFKMSNSAHAFTIWSDTLYSDKKLAVVREYICNATDAHIDADKMDTPIEIKLDKNELRIRDFGKGIADEKMADIFATYFNSTKQLDDAATGGFGLGSKSGFSYTDHFTIVSAHKGFRTIYAAHKSDDASTGAPGLTPMMTVPCGEDTGIEIIIPIDTNDQDAFDEKIREILTQGGILASYNGSIVEVPDYALLRHYGYGIAQNNEHSIQVLFGNVMYGISDFRAISADLDQEMRGSFQSLNNGGLLLYAPPSSVMPTPSRESLSMTPKTVETLSRLIRHAKNQIDRLKQPVFKDLVRRVLGSLPRDRYGDFHDICAYGKFKFAPEHKFGPEAVAYYEAKERLRIGDYSLKDIRRANRKLGRPELICGKPMNWLSNDNILKIERSSFILRQIMKVISKAGLFSELHYRDDRFADIERVASMKRIVQRENETDYEFERRRNREKRVRPKTLTLTLAAYKSHWALVNGMGLMIVTRGMDAAKIAQIKHFAESYGVQIIEVGPPKKEPKASSARARIVKSGHPDFIGPIENKDLFRPFDLQILDGRTPSRSLEKVDFYVEPKDSKHWDTRESKSLLSGIKKYVPGVCALLVDMDDEAKIKKEKTPRLETLVMDLARQRFANKKMRKVDRLALVLTHLRSGWVYEDYTVKYKSNYGSKYVDCTVASACQYLHSFHQPRFRSLVVNWIDPSFKKLKELDEAIEFWAFIESVLGESPKFYTTEEANKELKSLRKEVMAQLHVYVDEFMLLHVGTFERFHGRWKGFFDPLSLWQFTREVRKGEEDYTVYFGMLVKTYEAYLKVKDAQQQKEIANHA